MALVNPDIAMSFRQSEFKPRNAMAEYAQMQQIQGGQQAQELARFQLNAAKRAESVQNALTDAYASSLNEKGEVDYNKLIPSLAQRGGGAQIPSILKTRAEAEAAKLTQEKTRSEIDKNTFDLQNKRLKAAWDVIGSSTSPQKAIAEFNKGVKSGVFKVEEVAEDLQLLASMTKPEEFNAYLNNAIAKTLDAKGKLEQRAVTTKDTDRGGYIERQTYNAQGVPIGKPTRLDKTATIGETTAQKQLGVSQGQLSLAQQRLAQDAQGVTYQQDAQGNLVALPSRLAAGGAPVARPVTGEGGAPVKGKPSAFAEKAAAQRTQMGKDLDFAIKELGDITKDGGLIDQSTGSGAGRLFDIGAGFVGQATPGAIAIGKIAPVSDLALKMIPRFEGPQSDRDTASYKEAAGQLADPTLPTKIRKEAGKTVRRLMVQRKGQFATGDMAAEGAAPAAGGATGGWSVVK
jgi:hypothetical protein